MELKNISTKDLEAELMLHGKIETRIWGTKYRGWVLLCASKQGYHTSMLVLNPIPDIEEILDEYLTQK